MKTYSERGSMNEFYSNKSSKRYSVVNLLQQLYGEEAVSKMLRPEEIKVIQLRESGLTLKDTGAQIWNKTHKRPGVSTERVRQLESRAFANIFRMNQRILESTHLILEKENEGELPIEWLWLSVRTYGTLKRNRIDTVQQLCKLTEKDLVGIRNMGVKSVAEIKTKLDRFKLRDC